MMDKALEQTLAAIYSQSHTSSSTDGNGVCADAVDRKVKLLHEVVSSSFPQSSRHKVLVAVGTTLSASVHHPSPDMRAAAFTQLGEMLQCQGKVRYWWMDVRFLSRVGNVNDVGCIYYLLLKLS